MYKVINVEPIYKRGTNERDIVLENIAKDAIIVDQIGWGPSSPENRTYLPRKARLVKLSYFRTSMID
jgi:hypothetical protein